MSTDVFNNPSNDYINPGLAPCAGVSDAAHFEFTNDGAAIVSGADIIQIIDLSNINIPVTEWLEKKKTLSSGEVIYVPGLTKGLMNRTQYFDIPAAGYVDATSKYFMTLDISINYYNNFKYFNINVEASANNALNIDIDDAMNIALGTAGVETTLTYDPCILTFSGGTEGYEFNVTNVILTTIDSSTIDSSTYILVEDTSSAIPYAKYPNGGMMGYVLKAIYPADENGCDKWVYTNTVVSPFDVYETENVYYYDASTHETLTFDPSIVFSSLTFDISCNVADISVNYDIIPFEPSLYNQEVPNDQIYSGYYFEDCNYIDQATIAMKLQDSSTLRCDFLGTGGTGDSSITSSYIKDGSVRYVSDISTCIFSNSYIMGLEGSVDSMTRITDSTIQGGDNNILQLTILTNSTIEYCDASNNYAYNTTFLDSSIAVGFISGGWIQNSDLYDVSINDASLLCSNIYDGSLNKVFGYDNYFEDAFIENSEFKNSTFYKGTTLIDSSIQNSWTNGTSLTTSYIIDTSITNTILTDCSIYTSRVADSSLINCTLYNVSLDQDDSSIYLNECRNIMINVTCDSSITWRIDDTSVYYQKYNKAIEVGRSAEGTLTILSAGEYLDYINTHNLWNKVGAFASRITTDPTTTNIKNLVGGFYVFNPQSFPVKIEYILIN